ncbi:hypothetical protein NW767_002131 [Fusarium falciforme]|uniref:Mucin n=1 Tax=Fusarium falciforme TaxID=195108 RepID=A0A9W8V506_9HYPO|nr:hypothetical protein NW755_001586 [Fusarium falciforme]KAJ4207896.1 hypothetical protein NW767_002131 [Fusarium falciforme]KAJ4259224.1 hypothetical protein NW757_002554 [Fusarium falciforme]
MGQGDGEDATPVLSPQWTRGGWPTQGAAADGNIEDDNNRLTVSDISDAAESPFDVDNNRTFLDTETLCSRSGSSSHHLHPRPLHHYQRRPVHADSRIHAQHAHAYAPAFANRHSRDRSEPQLQTGRRHPLVELDLSDTLTTDEDRDFGDKSFLISRPTSIATMAMTTSTTDVSPISSGLNHPWRVELRLPTEALPDDGQCPNIQQYHDLLSEIDSEFLFPDNVLAAVDNRPSSSRSHLLHWRRNRSSGSDSSNPRVSSDCQPPMDDSRPSMIITREEFEALPPTIQRKYFSTIERSQFTHYPGLESRSCLGSVGHDHLSPRSSLPKSSNWGELERPVTSDSSTLYSNRRPRITSTDQRFYANLPEKIKRRHLTEEELLIAHDRPKSTPEAAGEPLDQGKKRPSQEMRMQSPQSSPGLSEGQSSFSSVQRRKSDREPCRSDSNRPDSFYDSFRWLEDEEGLDLRLYLDDYHINLREEVPVPNKSRRPSFRRHLSINKLPFGRPSVSYTRPLPREGVVSPTSISPSASQNSAIGSSGHIRRKSRALSLVSPNKQMSPRSSPPIDPAATHYQDPEARQKLRAYLASPQKFDEAIEFGFPSKDGSPREPTFTRPVGSKKENAKEPEKFRSFLEDDRSSKYSDDASVAEPDSPKTPQLFDKPAPVRPARTSTEQPPCAARSDKSVLDQASCREMTLRMTLTRPDLRQSEDQIYGWKQPGSSRGGSSRDDSSTNTVIYARDGNPKESIEKQLAALDEWGEDADHDNGVVKRFWNRVKRT